MFDATLQNAVLMIDDAALIVKVAVLKVQLYSRTSAVAVRVCVRHSSGISSHGGTRAT